MNLSEYKLTIIESEEFLENETDFGINNNRKNYSLKWIRTIIQPFIFLLFWFLFSALILMSMGLVIIFTGAYTPNMLPILLTLSLVLSLIIILNIRKQINKHKE